MDYLLQQTDQPESLPQPLGAVHRILALDLGTGSYGIALQERSGKGEAKEFSFPIVRSCTLPADWAELKDERTRRRMWKTRVAHKAREGWLRHVFNTCGLEHAVLYGRQISETRVKQEDGSSRYVLAKKADYQLEREFPPKHGEKTRDGAPSDETGASTVYCGAILRCLLLLGKNAQVMTQGHELEPWQVFKALHSAIQKRGYDAHVPWTRKPAGKVVVDVGTARKIVGRKKKMTGEETAEEAVALSSEMEEEQKEEDQASELRASTMKAIVEGLSEDSRHHYPCFWEAHRMGLWKAAPTEKFLLRQTHHARTSKWADVADPGQKFKPAAQQDAAAKLPAIFPRQMVEAEIIALCEAAAALLPKLALSAYQIMYGPTCMAYPNIPRRDPAEAGEETRRRAAYAALSDEQREKFVRGKVMEWQGVLAQKAPTFDNRGPAACGLIPRFNVAKCDVCRNKSGAVEPDSLFASEVSFLLQLKNFRFTPEVLDESAPKGLRDWFNPAELRKLHEDHFMATVLPRIESGLSGALTKKMLCDWMSSHIGPKATPKPGLGGKGKEIIETPKATGRARLSRSALRLVKGLLLSGLSPVEFKKQLLDLSNAKYHGLRIAVKLVAKGTNEMNANEMRGLIVGDLVFLDSIGASWEKISIRDERLEAFNEVTRAEKDARQNAIERMISAEINPKIRHRLTLLDHMLEDFTKEGKQPDRVVLEFAREEWLGPKRKKELMDFQNERKEQNITARMTLGSEVTQKTILKHQLCEEQGRRCLFCGGNFSNPETTSVANGELSFENAHLAHIVADTKGGPRAYVNLVLACDACNRAQGTLYHADAFAQKRFPLGWDTFVGLVSGLSLMRPFKKKILCTKSESEASEMVQNKTALQETAWIAKLARVLVCLKFGWRLDAEGQERRIVVVTGSVTNRVATRYGLYSLLGGPERVRALSEARALLESDINDVRGHTDADNAQEICERVAKRHKLKKRKGDDDWDTDYVCWRLRRLLIANEDALSEKDRGDDRHHALDAMILSFLPHWAGNPSKSLYFGLPPGRNWKEFFARYLEQLYPQVLISVRPELEQSFYGARRDGPGYVATKRYVLREIAYTGITPKFSNSTLGKQARRILDAGIRAVVSAFAATQSNEIGWLAFCDRLAKEGLKSGGPRILNVRCIVSEELTEYADFSKDGRGAWRKGDKNRGWFLCEKRASPGKYSVEPVYVHQSKRRRAHEIAKHPDFSRVLGYFIKGEWVSVARAITDIGDPLPAGTFKVRSMKADGRIELSSIQGYEYNPISATRLVEAGLSKCKEKS